MSSGTHRLLAVAVAAAAILVSCGKDDAGGTAPPPPASRPAAALVPGITQNLTPSKTPPMYHLDAIGTQNNPVGQKTVELAGDKAILIMGWAADAATKGLAGGVDVTIDQAPFGAHYGTLRTDVASYFKRPDYEKAGFELTLPPGQLTKGEHSISIRVLSPDRQTYYQGEVIKLTIS